MKKKIIALALIGIPAFTFVMSYCLYHFFDNKKIEIRQKIDVKNNDLLSIYLETAEGSGEYKVSDDNVFPTEGYTFNETKSKCENGGSLSFDKSTGQVSMSATSSDKCYVYFDIEKEKLGNFADYVKSLYETQGVNGIYYHNNTLLNGAGDNSYRYAGPSDTVNNFVCFGSDEKVCPDDNLYRIIGVFDNKVKLIKYDYATKEQLGEDGGYSKDSTPITGNYLGKQSVISEYKWGYLHDSTTNNDWATRLLNTVNLNTNFLNNIESKWRDKIVSTVWNVGGMTLKNARETNAKTVYNYELGTNKINKTTSAKIGLVYLSEYYYSASPVNWTKPGWNRDETKDYRSAKKQNWMYMGVNESTISRQSDNTMFMYYIHTSGSMEYFTTGYEFGIRPTFSLNADVELQSGMGNQTNPYRILI